MLLAAVLVLVVLVLIVVAVLIVVLVILILIVLDHGKIPPLYFLEGMIQLQTISPSLPGGFCRHLSLSRNSGFILVFENQAGQ